MGSHLCVIPSLPSRESNSYDTGDHQQDAQAAPHPGREALGAGKGNDSRQDCQNQKSHGPRKHSSSQCRLKACQPLSVSAPPRVMGPSAVLIRRNVSVDVQSAIESARRAISGNGVTHEEKLKRRCSRLPYKRATQTASHNSKIGKKCRYASVLAGYSGGTTYSDVALLTPIQSFPARFFIF
jgi:hypothetical protein